MATGRSLYRITAWVVVSAAFGVVDERLTRISVQPIADAANSRWLWACWPLLLGFGIGGLGRGALTGGIGTAMALLGFFLVHGTSLSNALNAEAALLPIAVVVGVVAGGAGGALRSRT